ncbi:MAG TPA: DNA-3-methyladenine glycosylase [Streptosporangiaceae bacterium]|jgi:DNA-3-methyladenine glycosylase
MGLGLTGAHAALPAPGPLMAREFFARPAPQVGPELLGCVLRHRTAAGTVSAVIVETEAYTGESDPASHAFRGQTARNAVMFGPPGHAYVYFSYGMHFCVNLVCLPAGTASAVLLRAGRVIDGAGLAAARRSARRSAGRAADLARGPGRLCQALGIDRQLDGADICAAGSPLQLLAPAWPAPGQPPGGPREDSQAPGSWPEDGWPLAADWISSGPRVGVSRAAEVAWRFWITGEPAVSPYRPSVPRRSRAASGQAAPAAGRAGSPGQPGPASGRPKPISGQPAGDETMPR